MSKKYIGVDLGAWLSKKTSIAICKLDDNKLILDAIKHETTERSEKPHVRNLKLISDLEEYAGKNAIIGIDAPFAIPYYLYNPLETEDITEDIYNPKDDNGTEIIKGELSNKFIFDNSARFVYKETNQIPLAPAGDKIGKMTARMVHIVGSDKKKNELNIIRNTELKSTHNIATIEVFPTTTIFKLAEVQNCLVKYFKTRTEQYDKNKKLEIKSYKGDNFVDKKDKKSQKERMLKLIEEHVIITEKQKDELIKTDDDYDAIICALTAYLVSQEDGYLKPNQDDYRKFTNSFIYIPSAKSIKNCHD